MLTCCICTYLNDMLMNWKFTKLDDELSLGFSFSFVFRLRLFKSHLLYNILLSYTWKELLSQRKRMLYIIRIINFSMLDLNTNAFITAVCLGQKNNVGWFIVETKKKGSG